MLDYIDLCINMYALEWVLPFSRLYNRERMISLFAVLWNTSDRSVRMQTIIIGQASDRRLLQSKQ